MKLLRGVTSAEGRKRLKIGAAMATATLAMVGLGGTFATSASAASFPFYQGELLKNVTAYAPLRVSPCDTCRIFTYIGQGDDVTMGNEYTGTGVSGFCKVNWVGNVGWTGCWRLEATGGIIV